MAPAAPRFPPFAAPGPSGLPAPGRSAWRRWLARRLAGAHARRLLDAARADLAALPLEAVVARRTALPLGRRRPLALRVLHLALVDRLARDGDVDRCLVRAAALLGAARTRGLAPALVIGVARALEGDFRSHAWLEADGRPLLEAPAAVAAFHEILRLPPPAGAAG